MTSSLRSQLNNLRTFRRLFAPWPTLRAALCLPAVVRRRDGHAGPPLSVNLHLIGQCNLDCAFCSERGTLDSDAPGLDIETLSSIAHQAGRMGASLFLGGGEPLLRPDVVEIVAAIRAAGARVGLITNATLLTPTLGRALKQAGLDAIIVSIHGLSADHDALTRRPGAFAVAVANVRAFCAEAHPPVVMNVVASPSSLRQPTDLIDLGRELRVDHVRFEHQIYLTPGERQAHEAWCAALSAPTLGAGLARVSTQDRDQGDMEEVGRLAMEAQRRHGAPLSGRVLFKPALSPAEISTWYREGGAPGAHCMFAWGGLFVDPRGRVVPCEHCPALHMGDVHTESLEQIWNGPTYRAFRLALRAGRPPACARCSKR